MKLNRIKNIETELVKRLEDNNWKKITIHMKKSNDTLTIEPFTQGNSINSLNDIDFFMVTSSSNIPDLGGCTITRIAEQIAEYDSLVKNTADERECCREFYNKKLKGHTTQELSDGLHYRHEIFKEFVCNKTKNDACNLIDFVDEYDLSKLVDDTHDETYIKNALTLAADFSEYSEWYRDLYGSRPNNCLTDNIS